MRLSTQCQDAQDQQAIAFEIDAEAEQLGRWVVSYLENQIRNGTRFLPGQTVEIGWMLLLLQQREFGLELMEPNFKVMPISWCCGLNRTIKHIYVQRAVCTLFECQPHFPSIRHAAITSPGFYTSLNYSMFRGEPVDSNSGWVLSDNDYLEDEGDYCSLYEIALRRLEVVPFLSLPSSSLVLVTPDYIEVTANGIKKSSTDYSLLSAVRRVD